MKIHYVYGQHPSFEMDFDERAVFISALQTFVASFPQDETAKRMLNSAEQIDAAMRAMQDAGTRNNFHLLLRESASEITNDPETLAAEAERLIQSGKMPSLKELLNPTRKQ